MNDSEKEELHRRLLQARRLMSEDTDALTKSRVSTMVGEIEAELAAAEIKDLDIPQE